VLLVCRFTFLYKIPSSDDTIDFLPRQSSKSNAVFLPWLVRRVEVRILHLLYYPFRPLHVFEVFIS
jgi:hypothetical protein